ncbi:MAG: nitroreductase family protein [Leeuwenhoekiella sp.]
MRPKRDVFAKDYIGETVDNFVSLWPNADLKKNVQLQWFHDVLVEYFKTAIKDEQVRLIYNKFQSVTNQKTVLASSPKKLIPYHRLDADKSTISYEEFFKLTRQRRSVRWFQKKPVERELIDKAILAANQSPSACNRQPFEFKIFDDPSLVSTVKDFPMGTAGYGQSIPVFCVIVGNLDAYFDERDRHVIYIDASLASMTLMLALETMGLSSVSINWPDVEHREQLMEQFLNLPDYQRPLMCLGIGYPDPDGLVAFSEKRPLDKIRSYNFYNASS